VAHRVNSRQRSTSVAFGAKQTLTQVVAKQIYEYTPSLLCCLFAGKNSVTTAIFLLAFSQLAGMSMLVVSALFLISAHLTGGGA
jgi:hypothetical protein